MGQPRSTRAPSRFNKLVNRNLLVPIRQGWGDVNDEKVGKAVVGPYQMKKDEGIIPHPTLE